LGSYVSEAFFREMISHGAEVKFVKKIRYSINLFSATTKGTTANCWSSDDKITHLSSLKHHQLQPQLEGIVVEGAGDLTMVFKKVFRATTS